MLNLVHPKPNRFYVIHDLIGLHYHFRLRTCLSQLRGHKFHHNFFVTPTNLCSCHQGIEDVNYFCLNVCFANHRARLSASITTILLRYNLTELANDAEFYLYGHTSISYLMIIKKYYTQRLKT